MSDNESIYENISHRRRNNEASSNSDSDSIIISTRRRAYRIASDSGEEYSGNNSRNSNDTSNSNGFISHRKRNNRRRLISGRESNTASSTSASTSSNSGGNCSQRKKIKLTPFTTSTSDSESSDSEPNIDCRITQIRTGLVIGVMNSSTSSSSSSSDQCLRRRRYKPRIVVDSDDEDEQYGASPSNRDTSFTTSSLNDPQISRLRDFEEPMSLDDSQNSSIRNTDDTDGSSSDLFVSSRQKKSRKKLVVPDSPSSQLSSDLDTQSECPICFGTLKSQELGTPEACDHTFCVTCLKEWAKNVNTCPVDRKRFGVILVRKKLGGKITERIPVETTEPEINVIDDNPTYCEICGECDREDRMMLCDGCDLGYHLECLTPPLESIPIEEWYCPSCDLFSLPDEIEEVISNY